MNKDKINFIREKCIEANPDIVSLKFGCEVMSTSTGEVKILSGSILGLDKSKKYPYYETTWGGFSTSKKGVPDSPYIKILGRPIRLADVLLAINANKAQSKSGIFVDTLLRFWEIKNTDGNNEMKIIGRWNLSVAEDLREQSEEMITFLYELLR